MESNTQNIKIGVIGLGYVGLPLACLFSTRYPVKGFDISERRLEELRKMEDSTCEVTSETLREAFANGFTCTSDILDLKECNFYIVTVPTPVNSNHEPDLQPLEAASRSIGIIINPGDTVVYESTVYPGTTEEFCIPIIEEVSGLEFNKDFTVGYSPERINPGDKVHTVATICKIVSGSTPEAAEKIDAVYSSVLKSGTHRASSIKVAEAAKVIENTQRDVNIAFMNEITKVFNALEIDTEEVLAAAGTKWNFLKFHPGLVGGHCISVDPYYLIRKAELHGLHPRLITEARAVNESMGFYLSDRVIESMNRRSIPVGKSRILMLGFSFKKDCPDIRNTKSYDTLTGLRRYASDVVVLDPLVDPVAVAAEYGDVPLVTSVDEAAKLGPFNVLVHCVDHSCITEADLNRLRATDGIDCGLINT